MEWPKITEDTPLEEVKLVHQAIWDCVSRTGVKPNTPYFASCVACEYDNAINKGSCRSCPILWGGGRAFTCGSAGSEYFYWEHSESLDEFKERAKAVRDVKFKFELEKGKV